MIIFTFISFIQFISDTLFIWMPVLCFLVNQVCVCWTWNACHALNDTSGFLLTFISVSVTIVCVCILVNLSNVSRCRYRGDCDQMNLALDTFLYKRKTCCSFLWYIFKSVIRFIHTVLFRQNPLWGSTNTPLTRWLPAEYEDDETQPKGWNTGQQYNGLQLPLVTSSSDEFLLECSQKTLQSNLSALNFNCWILLMTFIR